jgi:hypothetical protein
MSDVSTLRLYLLRAMYLLIALGMGSIIWPRLVSHEPWAQMEGVSYAMLGALSALALLGVRYPLQMLPLLFFELLWKSVWLIAVALPQSQAGGLDPDSASTVFDCLVGVVLVPLVLPWKYVIANYVRKPSERWRRRHPHAPAAIASPVQL